MASTFVLFLPSLALAQDESEAAAPEPEIEKPEIETPKLEATPEAVADEAVSEPELEERTQLKGLEEIVVTTRKTTENLQEVPISISALSESDLERRGHTIDRWGPWNELAGHAHGITIDQSAGTRIRQSHIGNVPDSPAARMASMSTTFRRSCT